MLLMLGGPYMVQTQGWPTWAMLIFAALLAIGGIAGMWINSDTKIQRLLTHYAMLLAVIGALLVVWWMDG